MFPIGEQLEHPAILSTFIKLPFVIKILSIFEWPLKAVLLYVFNPVMPNGISRPYQLTSPF